MYDSMMKGLTLEENTAAVRALLSHDFDLSSLDCFRDCDFSFINKEKSKGVLSFEQENWLDRLFASGIPEREAVFLYAVLKPDPSERMTAEEILDLGYLDFVEEESGNDV